MQTASQRRKNRPKPNNTGQQPHTSARAPQPGRSFFVVRAPVIRQPSGAASAPGCRSEQRRQRRKLHGAAQLPTAARPGIRSTIRTPCADSLHRRARQGSATGSEAGGSACEDRSQRQQASTSTAAAQQEAPRATRARPDLLRISRRAAHRVRIRAPPCERASSAATDAARRSLSACRLPSECGRAAMGAIRYCDARRAALCRAVTQDFFSFQKFFIDFMQITGMMVMWLRARARVLWKKQKIAPFEDCHPRTRFHMKFS